MSIDIDGWAREGVSRREAPDAVTAEHIRANPNRYRITDTTLTEAESLAQEGYDVQLIDPTDRYALSEYMQRQVDRTVEQLEEMERFARQTPDGEPRPVSGGDILRDATVLPAVSVWCSQLMHAMALQPTYRPKAATLGEGVAHDALDQPIFTPGNSDGAPAEAGKAMSAREIIHAELPEGRNSEAKASKKLARLADFERFVETPIDGRAEVLFRGTLDGAAIRTRAAAFIDVVFGHIRDLRANGPDELTIASLGCGAAGPLFELLQRLDEEGVQDVKVRATLVDQDVKALACAQSLAETAGVAEAVNIERRNLVTADPKEYMPEGADIVDLLGVFEYFPEPLAKMLLQRAASIAKPGGMIVFGNMVADREQQTFFEDVIRWPRLQQRGIGQMLNLIRDAGFEPNDALVRIPAAQGVYAVYALKVPTINPEDGLARAA